MQVVINGRKGHTIIVKYVVKRLSNAKGDNMKRNNKWLDLVLYILSAEVIGMSSGLLAGSFNEFFQKYNKPPLMPPFLCGDNSGEGRQRSKSRSVQKCCQLFKRRD